MTSGSSFDLVRRLLRPLDDPDPGTLITHRGEQQTWMCLDDWRFVARPRDPLIGEELVRFSSDSGDVGLRRAPDTGAVHVPFSFDDAFAMYVTERWRDLESRRGPAEWQLAAFYRLKRLIPRRVQLAARRRLMRRQAHPEFPRWPLEDGMRRLLGFYARCLLYADDDGGSLRFAWFWPRPFRAAAILTHDVESAAGLRLAIGLADIEEARGLRSSFNVVADDYPIDWGIVRELRDRGFELGLHGVHHDRSMFSSRGTFDEHRLVLERMADRLGASGFRSPATHRVFDWLGELPVSYDCTIPHSDPYEPQPGGCCTLWPFFIGDVVELPYTLPQDHTIFTLLGDRTIDRWVTQLDGVVERGGLAQCVTHPDPGYLGDPDKRRLYAEFLDVLAQRPEIWRALPRDAAEWWRARDRGDASRWPIAEATAVTDGLADVRLIAPS